MRADRIERLRPFANQESLKELKNKITGLGFRVKEETGHLMIFDDTILLYELFNDSLRGIYSVIHFEAFREANKHKKEKLEKRIEQYKERL